jgi:hypothetical protein
VLVKLGELLQFARDMTIVVRVRVLWDRLCKRGREGGTWDFFAGNLGEVGGFKRQVLVTTLMADGWFGVAGHVKVIAEAVGACACGSNGFRAFRYHFRELLRGDKEVSHGFLRRKKLGT